MRLTPIEKLQAARATAVDRRAGDGLDPSQGVVRKSIHFVAFLEPLHSVGTAADAARMPGKEEAAMGVQKGMIGARPATAFRALVHVGPQQFFEPSPVHANEALSTFVTGQGDGRSVSKVTPNLAPSRHLPDIIHRIVILQAVSFDPKAI